MALIGTREFEAHIRYFEAGEMRRYETPLHAHGFMMALVAAEKLVLSAHPLAEIMSIHIIDVAQKDRTKPRLAFANPAPPKSRA